MSVSRDALMIILQSKATSRVIARVTERVRAGICIGQHEDKSECTAKARCRGLCPRCEKVWRITRMKMTPEQAAIYDAKLIRCGRLLSPREVKEYTNLSVYRRLA